MAYRRSYARRRSQGLRKGSAQGGGGAAGRVLLGLLAVAAILYFVTASAAGSWLSDNIVNPVLEAFNPSKEDQGIERLTPLPVAQMDSFESDAIPQPQTIQANSADAGTATAPVNQGKELKLDAAQVFAVQMGAFKSEANANNEADVVRTRGGAGYVFDDGELYRVLASVYATEAEAQAVRAQLKEEEIESGLYPLNIKEVELRITAGDNVIEATDGAFSALNRARSEMLALSIAYDKKEVTDESAIASIEAIRDELRESAEKLKAEAGSDNSVIQKLESCIKSITDALDSLISDGKASTMDFSSKMKYTQIKLIFDTMDFVNTITASS